MCTLFISIPIFDYAVPARCEEFAGLVRVPQGGYADAVMSFPLLVQLRGLPVPNVAFAVSITRHQITGNKLNNFS